MEIEAKHWTEANGVNWHSQNGKHQIQPEAKCLLHTNPGTWIVRTPDWTSTILQKKK